MEYQNKPQLDKKKNVKINRLALKFDRIFSSGAKRQLLIIFGCFAVVLLIGCLAMWIVGYKEHKLNPLQWAFYLLVDPNALNNIYVVGPGETQPEPWVLVFSTVISLAGVVIFGGMFISVCSNLLNRRIESFRNGERNYLKAGHHVILGYDSLVPAIITDICGNDPEAYVLVQSSLPCKHVREMLSVTNAAQFVERVLIKRGHRTNIADLAELHLDKAVDVYVAGDRSLPQHDALNIECVEKLANWLNPKKNEQSDEKKEKNTAQKVAKIPKVPKPKLPIQLKRIVIVLENPDTFSAMQVADLFADIRDAGVELLPYNHHVACAQTLLVGNTAAQPARGGIAPDDKRHVHLVVAGMTEQGTTLAIEAAKVLHFPNFDVASFRTRITLIDPEADRLRHRFMARCRHFFEVQSHSYADLTAVESAPQEAFLQHIPATKFCGDEADFLDVEFAFIKADPSSPAVLGLLDRWATDDNQLLTVAFTLGDARHNSAVAMHLPDSVYDHKVPVWVQQDFSEKFLNQLRMVSSEKLQLMTTHGDTEMQGRYAHIYPFGMTDHFARNTDIQVIAECINHVYDMYFSDGYSREAVMAATWNEIHAKWTVLPVDKQWASFYSATGVVNVIGAIRAMRGLPTDSPIENITETELDRLAPLEHNRWMAERLLMGYRKPTTEEDCHNVTDPDRREKMKKANKKLFIHSDIRPYGDLDHIHKLDGLILSFIPWYQRMVADYSENKMPNA